MFDAQLFTPDLEGKNLSTNICILRLKAQPLPYLQYLEKGGKNKSLFQVLFMV